VNAATVVDPVSASLGDGGIEGGSAAKCVGVRDCERRKRCADWLAECIHRTGVHFLDLRRGPGTTGDSRVEISTADEVAGVSVQIVAGSTTVNAIPIFVSASQINAILPDDTATGAAALTVTYGGQTSNTVSFQVAAHSFGIFTVSSTPNGAGIITGASYQQYSVTAPARPGDAATIWGTGIGASPGDNGTAPPPQVDMPDLGLSVYVGGQLASVTYRGRSGFPGEDQINFAVPDGVTGCYIPVAVLIGNVVSNFATLAIAPAGESCPDPAPPQPSLPTGNVTLLRSEKIVGNSADWGLALFGDPQFLGTLPTQPVFDYPVFLQISLPPGACIGGVAVPPLIDVFGPFPLDAGPINITGPNGSRQLTHSLFPSYSMVLGGGPGHHAPPLYLSAGDYSVSSAGTSEVGAFSQSFTIPEPISWTNAGGIKTVERSAGVQVTWSGGDPNGTVYVTGAFGAFVCSARTSDQKFTVPPIALLSLPASGTSTEPLTLSATSSTAFSATGISSGSIDSTVIITKNVIYQ
jgi:uncharacterized protein (TIGR03437 family)